MPVAPAEFTSGFDQRLFVQQSVRPVADSKTSERKPIRDPHILLATTGQLPSTARLAMELHEAGAQISLIAPRNHPARVLDFALQPSNLPRDRAAPQSGSRHAAA